MDVPLGWGVEGPQAFARDGEDLDELCLFLANATAASSVNLLRAEM